MKLQLVGYPAPVVKDIGRLLCRAGLTLYHPRCRGKRLIRQQEQRETKETDHEE